MHAIQKTIKEGVVLGIEHAESLFDQFPYETARSALSDYKMRLLVEINEPSQETSERIQEDA